MGILSQLENLYPIAARSGVGRIYFDIGWRGRRWQHPLQIILAAGVAEADIVFRVPVVTFGGNSILTSCRVARQREIARGYLGGGSADALVRSPAIE